MGSIAEKYADHFTVNGIYYQVKEKLNGIDLTKYLDLHGEYNDRIQLSIVFCGILRNLHGQEIVHQDLKPAQIMMVDDETGKKTKLGFRLILSDFDWSIPGGNAVRIVGTPYYKSPEHYKNQTPEKASDIFTAGIMMYEFLTGRNPFDFDDTPEDEDLKKRVINTSLYKHPKELNDEISADINDVLLQCLNAHPDKRPTLEKIQEVLIGKASVSEGVPKKPEGAVEKFAISAGSQKMIIYRSHEFGRADMKNFFGELIDNAGNSLYKYCDPHMVSFSKEKDGFFYVFAPNETRNYFFLDGKRIDKEKVKINAGSKLELFSHASGKIIGSFIISW